MKILFLIILIIHSLIHLIGFLKGFNIANISNLKMEIKKFYAFNWLLTSIFFLISVLLIILDINYWQILLLVSIILSQLLVIKYWRDAKYGTIINVVAILVILPSLANLNFENQIQKEIDELKLQTNIYNDNIKKQDLKKLPLIVQKWINRSNILKVKSLKFVELKQSGKLKTEKNGEWMNFTAEQYFNLLNLSFIWVADVKMNPIIFFRGKDKFKNGVGEMNIKLLSIFDVVNLKDNNKLNTGEMIRFLAEIVWFPQVALYDNFKWEALSDTIANVSFKHSGLSVTGKFYFSANGDFKSFEAKRYFGGDDNAKEELWKVEALGYKEFNGIRIPNKNKVTWKLNDGDFTWLIFEINGINYLN